MADFVDIHIPPGMSDEEALLAVLDAVGDNGLVQKALRNPTSIAERGRARLAFQRLQGRFTSGVKLVYEQMDDVAQTVNTILDIKGVPREARQIAEPLVLRTHRRSIALLNHQFAAAYEQAFALGLAAGAAARGLTDNELAMVRKQRLNENAYAGNFLTDIAHGEGTMAYEQRATMYGNALEEQYWLGYLYADLSADRYVKWATLYGESGEPVEHCPDCSWLSGDIAQLRVDGVLDKLNINETMARVMGAGGRWGTGVYSAQELAELAIAPQSGKLTCTTHCKCSLRPAKRPRGRPRKGMPTPFRSIIPKEFTGTERDEDGRVVVTREGKTKRRKAYVRRAKRNDHTHIPRGGRG